MAQIFDINQPIVSNAYLGGFLFKLKEIAVDAGWEVIGSGEGNLGTRWAFQGELGSSGVGPLPIGEQGSGGDYDCWQTGASRLNASSLVAGDAGNTRAWCVLRKGVVSLLLRMTDQATGWAGYANIAIEMGSGVTATWTGVGVGPGTIPGFVTNEFWLFSGARANANGVIVLSTTGGAGTLHLFASDTPKAGGLTSFGYLYVSNSGPLPREFMRVAGMEIGTSDPSDPGPWVCFWGSSPPGLANIGSGVTFNPLTGGGQFTNTSPFGSSYWLGGANIVGANDPLTQLPISVTSTPGARIYKGVPDGDLVVASAVGRGWGNYGLVASGRGWAYAGGAGGMMIPWPAALPLPIP